MPGIGGIRADAWTGTIAGITIQPDIYTRLGGRGSGVQSSGEQAAPSQVQTVTGCSSLGDAFGWQRQAEALQGTVVSVALPNGQTLSRVLIHKVTAIPKAARGMVAGFAVQARCTIDWTLEVQP